MKNKNNFAIIMAGGIGTRFWPLSRTKKPKQFIDILGTGETLIRQTYNRLNKICHSDNIFVVTNKIYKTLVSEQLPEIPQNNILCEPFRRNTAPCICYALHKILLKNTDAIMIVAPSDHIILKEDKFVDIINYSMNIAAINNCLITIGISPSRPDTGYGYIHIDTKKSNNIDEKINKVKAFKEKPDIETAKKFLADGNYVWNAGIFIWSAKAIQEAFKNYLPDIENAFAIGKNKYNSIQEEKFINTTYESCENISIDYGIMEKAKNVYVYKADLGWSDLGTWGSLFANSKKDENNNVINDNVITYNTKNCIIKNELDKLVIIDGLNDYIIVNEDNVLLICEKHNEQKIKDIVKEVGDKFGDKFI